MFIIKNKKIFISISAVLVALSIFSITFFGFNVGIDFKGGAMTEVSYNTARPSIDALSTQLGNLNFGSITIQPAGETNYIIKSRDLTEKEHTTLLEALSINNENELTEVSFNSIGPSVGRELTKKAIIAIILVSLAIILFIAYVFRKVSEPVSSWKYGLIAVVTLLHDVLIPSGIFVILSKYSGAELDTLFVVAVLTIIGLSVSDTIVIFDRIRENLNFNKQNRLKISFTETVGKSLEQSFARSIITSLSTLFVLVSLVLLGPVSTRYFALMLAAGMFFGTYSSIFLASSLLVLVEEKQQKK